MVELLAAMAVMSVGLLAVYSMFASGMVQIKRASTITTAAALADAQLEKIRAIKYESIGLDSSALPTGAPYTDANTPYLAPSNRQTR